MDKIILVGAGGFVGSILRYIVSGYIQQITKSGSPVFNGKAGQKRPKHVNERN